MERDWEWGWGWGEHFGGRKSVSEDWRWAETDTLEDPKVTTVAGAAELGWVRGEGKVAVR